MDGDSGPYDRLLDAEREALGRDGRKVGKLELTRTLREATGLGPADARRAVGLYLARKGGRSPSGRVGVASSGWIDDLLDAERAEAARGDRPVTRLLLIKALRGASGLGPRQARRGVEDYLRRRGGQGLPKGSSRGWWALVVLVAAAVIGAILVLRG